MSFLSSLRFLVPSWLNDAITQSHATLIDEFVSRARAGLEARFPSRAQPDALALIGEDRGIPRGRTETDKHYAQRLIGWRYPRGHRVRGSAFALLNQASEFFGGVYCWTIDVKGNRHVRTAAGAESFSYGYAWDWDGGADTRKGRFWLVLQLDTAGARPNPPIGSPALWDNKIGPAGRGFTIGHQGVTTEDARAIRNLFTGECPWKPAGTAPVYAVITLDNSTPNPTAGWRSFQGRSPNYRYWRL